jgi:hypothetical protein
MMKKSYQAAWCIGAILAAAAPRSAAATTVVTQDAFDLATAFAPTPGGATVVGNYTEVSNPNQVGTFTDGTGSIGFSSGIILSTGSVSQIGIAASGLSTGFGGTPTVSTSALLSLIPGLGSPSSDSARLSITINPGLVSGFINFSFGYMSGEISPSDKFGIFLDGVYTGLVDGYAIDQGNPWIKTSASSLGFDQTLYQNGNPLNPSFFTLSLEVPASGAAFDLDFVLADGFGDGVDTAVFLGDFSATTTALGTVAVPEVSSSALVVLAGLAWMSRRKRRQ